MHPRYAKNYYAMTSLFHRRNLMSSSYIMLFVIFIAVVTIAPCHSLSLTPSVVACNMRDKYVDCSHLDLKLVPSDIPEDIETLILHNVSLSSLPPGIFSKFPNLSRLELTRNRMKKLSVDLFKGVHVLETLDLSDNNELPFNHVGFPDGIFRPLGRSLQTLRLQADLTEHIPPITAYPDTSLADLYSLTTLQISMFTGVKFGPGFANLTKLQVLKGETCKIDQLLNYTLRYFRNAQLHTIDMHSCAIYDIEPGTFSGFPKLQFLDLSDNPDLGLIAAFDSLAPLEHQHLKEINFRRVHSLSFIVLDRTTLLKLRNICVETLDIGHNVIAGADFSAIEMFEYPQCYKTLRMAEHQIMTFFQNFIFLPLFTKLVELDISGKPWQGLHNRRRRMSGQRYTNYRKRTQSAEMVYVSLPSSLKVINMSYAISYTALDITVVLRHAENLQILDLAYSGIHRCYFSIEGLINLKTFNISNSACSDLKPEFLFSYGNLTELSFRHADLAKGLTNDPDGLFFSKQTHLEYLDLCCNSFVKIHDNLLNHNKKIGSINLSSNKLPKIHETVLKSETLHYLDMSFNVLSSLTENERRVLDSHVRPNRAFSLMLDGNPFICSCSTIDFLEWLANTHVTLDNAGNYSCFTDNGTQTLTSYQISRLHEFRVACVSDFWLRFSVISCSLALVTIVLSAFGYRYRWNIKYWFLTRCTGRYNPAPEEHYSYDIFVAYNHEDYQWVCGPLRTFLEETGPHKYRLCLHHRDFPVGQSIQGNIVSAMNDSRKIILVLTTRFLTCTWGEYEMEIAAMRDVTGPHSGDGVIIAVLLDDVPTRLMPSVLLNMWKNITFLVWSQDPPDKQMFWNRLVEAIER